jgi:hypothetical protein
MTPLEIWGVVFAVAALVLMTVAALKMWSDKRREEHTPVPQPLAEPGPMGPKLSIKSAPEIDRTPVFVLSRNDRDVILEGPVLTRLFVPAHGYVMVTSPCYEVVSKDFDQIKTVQHDAAKIVYDMIEQFHRSIAIDEMDPKDLKVATWPYPRRALARISERTGLIVTREYQPDPEAIAVRAPHYKP